MFIRMQVSFTNIIQCVMLQVSVFVSHLRYERIGVELKVVTSSCNIDGGHVDHKLQMISNAIFTGVLRRKQIA